VKERRRICGCVCGALVLASALLLPGQLSAQESIFGVLGFGLPDDGLSVRSRGMGNASAAVPGIHFTFRNPAALAGFDRTGISVASLLQSRRAEDATGESTQNSAEVPFIQLAFPLGSGLVLGGGYYRYLDFDGFIDTATLFRGDSLPVRLTTDGGISVLSPQLAGWLSRALRIGAGADFYTGSRKQRRDVEFDPDVAVSTSDSVEYGFTGLGFSAGVHVSPVNGLLLGAGYRSKVTLEGDLETAPGFDPDSDSDADGDQDPDGGTDPVETDTLFVEQIDVELPETIYAGASYRLNPRLLLAGELEIARWENFEIDGEPFGEGEDVVGFGGGVEYTFPRRLLILAQGTVLRAGARTRTLPQRFGGEPVRERAVSLGVGQVIGIGASNLDLSLEAGGRGSLDKNGIEEPFFRLGISLSAFEQWSSPTP
jgi:hypothetical protein